MPDYNALSYCWGDATRTHQMQLDGKHFALTTSVYEALQRLRPERDSLCIWIGQVCVNQDGIEERDVQVQQMGQIYQQAANTFIWLGPAHPGMEESLQIMRQFCSVSKDDSWTALHYTHIKIVLYDSWFHRVWVVQEAVLAQGCVFVYGHDQCNETELSNFAPLFYRFCSSREMLALDASAMDPRGCRDGLDSYHNIFSHLRRIGPKTRTLALPLLQMSRNRECSDEKKHVFGLHGLFARSTLENLVPRVNYGKSTIEIFTETTRLGIVSDGSWKSLIVAHDREAQSRHDSEVVAVKGLTRLPSWVPDWSCG
ncbi:hypothetical protein LTR78_000317 [Recurvomyces mirabilis]|uniref:Heterokaryon incompatibility domain-containing protein n=1 Tax=Recurvomyces mirabilis TaxID=574656 RepID=A0AAE1C6C8_9PEZI|nr:hypothetical protein LTR78_000317 [Recurvomyces mirabilis]KAK5161972.1 hypothetical protein LTS14_000318 [Recurvomyces mirabilis]